LKKIPNLQSFESMTAAREQCLIRINDNNINCLDNMLYLTCDQGSNTIVRLVMFNLWHVKEKKLCDRWGFTWNVLTCWLHKLLLSWYRCWCGMSSSLYLVGNCVHKQNIHMFNTYTQESHYSYACLFKLKTIDKFKFKFKR